MRRRVLEVELDGVASVVRGPGSRELVVHMTGRPPVWLPSRGGWSVQERTARDVVAAASVRNFDVVITGPRSSRERAPVQYVPPEPAPAAEAADPGEGLLW